MGKRSFLITLLLVGCAGYNAITKRMRSDFLGGRYEAALEELENSDLKTDARSRLLYHMERALILDRLNRPKEMQDELMTSDKIADDLYTTSITSTAKSFIISDRSTDYEGEIFEKVAIHIMLGFSFIGQNNLDAAGVEARKINNVLIKITQDFPPNNNSYREDAFARYFSALIYEANGHWDDAIIDYRKALELYDSNAYQRFYRGGVNETMLLPLIRLAKMRGRNDIIDILKDRYPNTFAESEAKWAAEDKSFGEIVVLHEIGSIATKLQKEFIIPWRDEILRFSFPYYPNPSSYYFEESGVEIEGTGLRATGKNLADLNAIAYRCLEDRRGRMIAKNITRLIAKSQIKQQADRNLGPLAGLLVNIFNAATETADTRSWTTLPAQFSVSRLRIKAGTYSLQVKTAGRLSRKDEVVVKAGKVKLLRAF